jgi:hypothetical protein
MIEGVGMITAVGTLVIPGSKYGGTESVFSGSFGVEFSLGDMS